MTPDSKPDRTPPLDLAAAGVDRIAVLFSSVNVRRFIPGFIRYARPRSTYWQLSIYHSEREIIENLHRWNPVGIVCEYIAGMTEKIAKLGIPTVVVTRDASDIPNVSWVDVDNRLAGANAADFFIRKRLRHFAFYGRRTDYSKGRREGYLARLNESGLAADTFWDGSTNPQRYSEYWPDPGPELQAWLTTLPKPVGILAAHDPAGRALIEACQYAGIRVPRDVAVLGINDDPLVCEISNPGLSSVRIPWTKLGTEALALLDAMIAGDPPSFSRVSPTLINEKPSTDVMAVESPLLRRALECIRDHLESGLDVADLVKLLNCSRRHLERVFRAELDTSPKDEIRHRRLAVARDLLLRSDHKITAIARLSGFKTPERFFMTFRDAEGMTPGEFRKTGGSGNPRFEPPIQPSRPASQISLDK